MTRHIMLDTGVLGLLTHPRPSADALACHRWVSALQHSGDVVVLPELVDYEQRREILLQDAAEALVRLTALHASLLYWPLTTPAMQQAAAFWAQARRQGRPTADRFALDGDVILAAQAAELAALRGPTIIATTNVGHLRRFVPADLWPAIGPEQS